MHKLYNEMFEYAELLQEIDVARIQINDHWVVMETRERGVPIACEKMGHRCSVSNDDKLTECARIDEQTVETNFYFLHPQAHALKIEEFVSAAM